MDVDNAATGNGGKDALPQDHNRDHRCSTHQGKASKTHLTPPFSMSRVHRADTGPHTSFDDVIESKFVDQELIMPRRIRAARCFLGESRVTFRPRRRLP